MTKAAFWTKAQFLVLFDLVAMAWEEHNLNLLTCSNLMKNYFSTPMTCYNLCMAHFLASLEKTDDSYKCS